MPEPYIGCIGTLFTILPSFLLSSDVIVMFKHIYCQYKARGMALPLHCYVNMMSSCNFTSQHIQELLGAFFRHKMRYLMEGKKKNPVFL